MSRTIPGKLNTPEILYAKGQCAQWLLRLMAHGVVLDSDLFDCLE
jgi:hypothetical protein